MASSPSKEELRREILDLTAEYYRAAFAARKIVPGESYIPTSGRVFDEKEMVNLVDSALDFWLTEGRFNQAFEERLADFFGLKFASTVNSGSSANLIAFYALTSEKLSGREIRKGDEVIETASCFPTTLAPVVQFGAVPVFVDTQLSTYNPLAKDVLAAVTGKTKAIFLAHTLGNPYEVEEIADFCKKRGIWLIEDCCDALGAKYKGRKVGTFGDIATVSFYPAHQITCGEGGAVLTNNALLDKNIRSFRDWGRDCWCATGKENTCGVRFKWKLGKLPRGYDHKYIYSHVGFNLKMTDMQAAVGLAQMEKLEGFIRKRAENHAYFVSSLKKFSDYLILPEATHNSEPSWFGFLITLRKGVPFSRSEITEYLESQKVATRLLFGGNITKQPAFQKTVFRVPKPLRNSDIVMNNTFWIGCYPGISKETIDYTVGVFEEFMESKI
ncbi:MAG: lipopolysaccharide biosynthesis protein RfbH [Patescibacteria group bacterium]|nr:lipopolysaccharide biosynthesis protein RfbH [Patescibacteria group bacterium]